MYNIAFFSNQFSRKNGTGVNRYARNMVKAFAELNSPFQVIPVATWSNMEKNELCELKAATKLKILPTGRIATRLLWTTVGIPKIENLLEIGVDVVHSNDLGFSVATAKPYVVTVHDIGPLIYPAFFKRDSNLIMQMNLKYAIKRAAAFICVSQTTADSLRQYVKERYSEDVSGRTYVTYEGISDHFFRSPNFSVLNNFTCLHQPFILAVGKISPRKNLEVVIRAFNKLRLNIPHDLIIAGGDGWDFQKAKNLVDSLGLTDRIHFAGYVSDEQLHALYAKATLFIYPSLFEGFGLPVLEAMATGCPVITSNISSLPEIAGDAALLIDPHNVGEVTSAMETVCNDQDLASELKQKGKVRSNRFSWKNCATQTLAIYTGLIS